LEKKFKLQAHAIYSTVYNICSDYFVLTTTFACRTFHRQIGTNYCVFNQSINQSITQLVVTRHMSTTKSCYRWENRAIPFVNFQWRSYRGFRRFNEPGPPSSWGPPSQATKN